jgi:hypothetical protein
MKKSTRFDKIQHDSHWPEPEQMKPYFLGPGGRWEFEAGGCDGSLRLDNDGDTIKMYMTGHSEYGVHLNYISSKGGKKESFSSKGSEGLLWYWFRDNQDNAVSFGLTVPFKKAWEAVSEFLESDGKLPKSIDWIKDEDIPRGVIPDSPMAAHAVNDGEPGTLSGLRDFALSE